MTKIVITGGGGFIGSHLIEGLLTEKESNVIAVDISKEAPKNIDHLQNKENFTYVQGDITDKELLERIVTDDVDVIYHLAAIVGVEEYCKDPLRVIEVSTIGTRNVLDIARLRNTKMVFSSTSEIYGKNPQVPWKEDSDRVLGDPTIDRWSYSTTKAVCEHMIHATHRMYNLPTVVVRYFNAYGPRQRPHFVISAMIYRVLKNQNPIVYNTGAQTRCFTYIKDVIKGTIAAANSPKANGEVFNIGSTRETRIKDLAQLIIKLAGKSDTLHCEQVETKKLFGGKYEDLSRRVPDTTKAKKLLGWQAETPLEQGLKESIDWALKNRWWPESH